MDLTLDAGFTLSDISTVAEQAMRELLEVAAVPTGGSVVLGCSSSEIRGERIGTFGSEQIGVAVVAGVRRCVLERGVWLAVQGCEHINRALVVEREYALAQRLEVVSVVPALHAGGSVCVAAFDAARDPVMVEHVVVDAGLDIGDTEVAMHVRHVQVPVRLAARQVGGARVTAVRYRPKLIGGQRAQYQR
ncbi:TIGR01440 family protein [Dermatophilus congolensis]|uniref:TIGR01440 family protein n=1 Tax=Dermatophilus congolensis TaxID=1863 RepID=UPI001DF47CD3|nr:TIGR01440 family protein [Dermatophilus congolensis]MBO3143062.1 TIGR01440 family protein [Dermatophilus congolensis]MBO3152051.1 TIGR01440 family protein [Dermatophilus congolensis]MBO3160937.1 TIGR01440 family protein [Dermatophilus congolensis]MBO3163337.1 TIGR01440 family protein [Dermatophilus congolensis]MBO3176890.1 TIGR01440 family protein [Dermatophilus congolensis]